MWSQRVQEESGGVMRWADLGAAGLSVQGPVGDTGHLSVVIIMLRGRCSPSFSSSLSSSYLRLHFSRRAKVRWPREPREVKGNGGPALGQQLSLAKLPDLLNYNFLLSFLSFIPQVLVFVFMLVTKLGQKKCIKF